MDEAPSVEQPAPSCPSCGTIIAAHACFCRRCGTALSSPETTRRQVPTTVAPPAPSAPSTPPAAPIATGSLSDGSGPTDNPTDRLRQTVQRAFEAMRAAARATAARGRRVAGRPSVTKRQSVVAALAIGVIGSVALAYALVQGDSSGGPIHNTNGGSVTPVPASPAAGTGSLAKSKTVRPASASQATVVRSVLDRYAAAYRSKDLAQLAALLAPSFRRRPGTSPIEDRIQALAGYRQQLSGVHSPDYHLGQTKISADGRAAWADTTYSVTDRSRLSTAGSIAFHLAPSRGTLLIDRIDVTPTQPRLSSSASIPSLTVADDGRIGDRIQLHASTTTDILAAFGQPDRERSTPPDSSGRGSDTLEYRCSPQDASCKSTFWISSPVDRLSDFETSSPQFATQNGTRVGMSLPEAERREGTSAFGCFGGPLRQTPGLVVSVEATHGSVTGLLLQAKNGSGVTCPLRPCGSVAFSGPGQHTSFGAFNIQVQAGDCATARLVAGASEPAAYDPNPDPRRPVLGYSKLGFVCVGHLDSPQGLATNNYRCVHGATVVTFARTS